MDIGIPIAAQVAGSHAPSARFINIVREALVMSVTCSGRVVSARPGPKSSSVVRFHTSHESIVPAHSSPRSARSRAPST